MIVTGKIAALPLLTKKSLQLRRVVVLRKSRYGVGIGERPKVQRE